MEDYRRLKVYQKAVEFENELHSVVLAFPLHYRRKLGVQLDDDAESIGANIAEGVWSKEQRPRERGVNPIPPRLFRFSL